MVGARVVTQFLPESLFCSRYIVAADATAFVDVPKVALTLIASVVLALHLQVLLLRKLPRPLPLDRAPP